MPQTLKLWTWQASPFAGKVRVGFREKDVPVELLEIHPVRRPTRLRELNPFNRVPVLEVDGAALRESSAILEWLEETYPSPALWPADATERAQARGWARWLDDNALITYFLAMRKQAFPEEGDPPDEAARLLARMARVWPRLDEGLGERDGPWMMGDAFTYADVAAMPLAVRLPQWSPQLAPDPEAHPRVADWLEALRARPSAAAIEESGPERLEG